MHASSTVLLTDGDEITSHLELVIPFVAISNAGGTGGVITIGAIGEAPADTLDRLINALVVLRNGIVRKAGGGEVGGEHAKPGWHRPGVAGGCPISSSITGQPCELEEGHAAWSAVRFHKYSFVLKASGALEARALDGDR